MKTEKFDLYPYCCRSRSEKKALWLVESLVIFGLSLRVFSTHHSPLFLWFMAFVALMSAMLPDGNNSVLPNWESLKKNWDDFFYYVVSMKAHKEQVKCCN